MASTQWGAVVDALLSTMRATTGYRAPDGSTSAIPVYDGPEYQLTNDHPATFLIVGWSGELGEPEEAGTSRQSPGPMAPPARPRDEEGLIRCRAVSQVGDSSLSARSVKDVRDAALAVVADVESALRAAPQLGLEPTLPRMVVEMAPETQVRQYVRKGVVCEIDFQVTYKARI